MYIYYILLCYIILYYIILLYIKYFFLYIQYIQGVHITRNRDICVHCTFLIGCYYPLLFRSSQRCKSRAKKESTRINSERSIAKCSSAAIDETTVTNVGMGRGWVKTL